MSENAYFKTKHIERLNEEIDFCKSTTRDSELDYSLGTYKVFCWYLTSFWLYFDWSSRPEVFCKKGVLKYFANFTEKHLCQRPFYNKVACWGLKKETVAQVFSCEFCEIFKKNFFYKTSLVAASETRNLSDQRSWLLLLFWIKTLKRHLIATLNTKMLWSLMRKATDNKIHPYIIKKKERKEKNDNKIMFLIIKWYFGIYNRC